MKVKFLNKPFTLNIQKKKSIETRKQDSGQELSQQGHERDHSVDAENPLGTNVLCIQNDDGCAAS